MKTIPFRMNGTEYALTLKVATYPDGNLAIKLYQESFGQLVFWDSLTTDLSGLRPQDCGFINTQGTGERYYAWIKRNNLGQPTGQIRSKNGLECIEYLFNAKKLQKLDPDGYTYYIRRFRGELHRKYERFYIALRRVAKHIPDFHYMDYSGWRRLNNSDATIPLWIEADDPVHHRHFIFEHHGIVLRTTIIDSETGQKQCVLHRYREDMAAYLLALFQDELPSYAPWSDERHKKSDSRIECSISQTFKDTFDTRQKSKKKKTTRRKSKNEN